MEDHEQVENMHRLIKQARREIGAGVTSLQATNHHMGAVKNSIKARISEAMEVADTALELLNALEKDQSCWGKYESHPSGNNN